MNGSESDPGPAICQCIDYYLSRSFADSCQSNKANVILDSCSHRLLSLSKHGKHGHGTPIETVFAVRAQIFCLHR